MLSTSAFLALSLRCAASIHPDTAQEIARIESGFNPYAIGVVGQQKGIFPKDINDALSHVKILKAQGKNYSVGLMQINQSNFNKYNVTEEQLFNPCTNLSVFEKIITDCYQRGGTLKRALSCYYSGNFETGQRPEKTFSNTSYIQRIGYIVPSTRQDRQGTDSFPDTPEITIVYPDRVIRGPLPVANKTEHNELYYPTKIVRGNILYKEEEITQ
ncbi:lytic transglycosylase domain-containing protein [Salmonella enterica]|uniref:lytic transglycosylase domain-containing protein n=1 Tax=Salmonella enterica TaxID=28901 RepID=UPI003D31022B